MNKPARIIPRSTGEHQTDWQQSLASAVRDPRELLRLLGLDQDPRAIDRNPAFPVRVPHEFIARMEPGNPEDPLLRQVLSLADENIVTPGYTTDPLAEQDAMAVPGLLHKYAGRVLLTLTGACAVHCRYCFRRHFPYNEANPGRDNWQAALAYVRERADIHEVILSGGDPLSLSDARLAELFAAIDAIPHISRVRIHTRVPVVIPSRVTSTLRDMIAASRVAVVCVVHINHPREIDQSLVLALSGLSDSGATLLNQAVLLKGINDSLKSLAELSETLFKSGVLPYYLHLLDPVQGAAHFAVEAPRARQLLKALSGHLPGYLVPRLVQELPGEPSKTAL